jgi:RNA polymerase sigma-70 factor (ECF subfamily)
MHQKISPDLLEAFQRGDQKAFKVVFDIYYVPIRYFTKKVTNHDQESEDITIVVFRKLFNLCDRFDTECNIKAFLYISARNMCLDYLRKVKWRRTLSLDVLGIEINLDDNVTIADVGGFDIIDAEVIEKMYAAIEELPDKCKQIIKLIYFYEMDTASIARQLSIKPETVRSHKRRGLELLRIKLFGKHGILFGQ